MTKKYVDGVLVDLTTEEENARDQEISEWNAGALDRALDILRQKRKPLLEETDWMANSDVTMSNDWKTYRQELRDITNGLDTVEKVDEKLKMEDGKFINFPTKPGE